MMTNIIVTQTLKVKITDTIIIIIYSFYNLNDYHNTEHVNKNNFNCNMSSGGIP